jgi:hypothetical protein
MIKNFKLFNEKYIHTSQDKIDDMNIMQEFAKKFEDIFEYRLNLNIDNDSKFRTYLGHGANKSYTGTVEIYNQEYYKTKRKIRYSINIITDINPAGISGPDDIGRTFTIDFDIKQENRLTNKIPDFYSYERTMDEIIEKFNNYVYSTLNIKYLSEKDLEQKKIEKSANKYNL